uniref:Uncharacterized protein n=1 Tax=Arundo donax TaxID=35708 RepID=A0A0A9BDF6_ARUDO
MIRFVRTQMNSLSYDVVYNICTAYL